MAVKLYFAYVLLHIQWFNILMCIAKLLFSVSSLDVIITCDFYVWFFFVCVCALVMY